MKHFKLPLSLLGITCFFIFFITLPIQAQVWEYGINEGEEGINAQKTSAVVDTTIHEIRLLKNMPGAASFLDDGINDYILNTPAGITRYFFDGAQMQSSVIIPAAQLTNPVAVFTSSPYPDAIIGQGSVGNMEVAHYSFDGSSMIKNPSQTIAGLTQVSKVVSRNVDTAFIDQDKILYYGIDENGNPIKIPALSDETGSLNPIDIALFTDNYDSVFIDKADIKYQKNGSIITALTGMTGAISISTTNFIDASGNTHREAAILTEKEKKHYSIDSTGNWTSNAALSVTSGLTKASCVVLHPDNHNALIVDGDDVKFYMYDGTKMVYNPSLSVTVAGLQNLGFYTYKGIVESKTYTASGDALSIKLDATEVLEPNTSIQYYVTATADVPDGSNWTSCNLGDWTDVAAGKDLRWKAILKTTNKNNTPRIKPAIKISTNSRPDPPTILASGAGEYYLDSTPLIQWIFNDPDLPHDSQSAFQMRLYTDAAKTNMILDTGKILSGSSRYEIDSARTGLLWATGQKRFYIEMRVWDQSYMESEFSSITYFDVQACDRPRVSKTYSPLNETAQYILFNTISDDLPKSKAGAMIEIELDSIGVNLTPAIKSKLRVYRDGITYVPEVNLLSTHGSNERWQVKFYTEASNVVCPTGTIIKLQTYNSSDEITITLGGNVSDLGVEPDATTPQWWKWAGYSWWAEGIIYIEGSIWEDWIVILKGSQR